MKLGKHYHYFDYEADRYRHYYYFGISDNAERPYLFAQYDQKLKIVIPVTKTASEIKYLSEEMDCLFLSQFLCFTRIMKALI